jgi:adenylate cyclase
LIERRDRVVTKNELLDLVWPGLVVEENNLQVQISALRKLLGQDAIATVAGRGYRFTVALELSPAAVLTADAGPLSIVVLPFQNLTGDANQAYVADGVTASLTADLSRIRDAFIVNATATFAYKDKPLTAQQVGKDLGVHFVLHGSVQRNGTKIRINAQLADATSNAQLWSESFEGDQSDLFALQDRVTTLIGNSIGRQIVIRAARESETRKSNQRVADLMLRARALKLNPLSLKTLRQSEDLYRQALALEPSNTSAMVGLAVPWRLKPAISARNWMPASKKPNTSRRATSP